MCTKFEKAMLYYNHLMSKVEFGSDAYKLLCLAKYRYIEDYNVAKN